MIDGLCYNTLQKNNILMRYINAIVYSRFLVAVGEGQGASHRATWTSHAQSSTMGLLELHNGANQALDIEGEVIRSSAGVYDRTTINTACLAADHLDKETSCL